MASVHGGGNFRAIVVQGLGQVRVIQRLLDTDPDPSDSQLVALANAYAKNGENDLPVRVRVVSMMRPGPFWSELTTDENMALAGLNDDGSVGTPQTNAD